MIVTTKRTVKLTTYRGTARNWRSEDPRWFGLRGSVVDRDARFGRTVASVEVGIRGRFHRVFVIDCQRNLRPATNKS